MPANVNLLTRKKDDITAPNGAKKAFLKAFGKATMYAAFAVGISIASPAFADETVTASKPSATAQAPASEMKCTNEVTCFIKESSEYLEKGQKLTNELAEVEKKKEEALKAAEEAEKEEEKAANEKKAKCDKMKTLLDKVKELCDAKNNDEYCQGYEKHKPTYDQQCTNHLSQK
ncbi:MAG: hypothetical protein N3G76_01140 [Candidatus Micrarchaeota archaeon]|nr:hypothetical protein [Candidatus Micrarchaeota archaeon]